MKLVGLSGIAQLSVIPLRLEPKHTSAQVSQLLFGETYKVVDQKKGWLLIQLDIDGYHGWMAQNQYFSLQEELVLDRNLVLKTQATGNGHLISPGSYLSGLDQEVNKASKLTLEGFAFQFLNTPYLWGGKSIWGIDCSGFTQLVWRSQGRFIPRDAKDQAELGEEIPFSSAQKGDLCFFSESEASKKITHVGILLEENSILHASGCVKKDKISEKGIVDQQGNFTHALLFVKTGV